MKSLFFALALTASLIAISPSAQAREGGSSTTGETGPYGHAVVAFEQNARVAKAIQNAIDDGYATALAADYVELGKLSCQAQGTYTVCDYAYFFRRPYQAANGNIRMVSASVVVGYAKDPVVTIISK